MDAVAFIRSTPLPLATLGLQQISSGNLDGMENSLRLRTNPVMNPFSRDFPKMLPLASTQDKHEDRTSSIYSTEISDLIDFYLSGQSTSSKDSLESPSCDQHQHLQYTPSTPRFCHGAMFSASDSTTPTISTYQDYGNLHCQANRGSTKHRYSNPEPRPPEILDLRTHGLWDDEDLDYEKSVRDYRDTLLPTPFTPILTQSPGICHDLIPLRGQRSTNSLAVGENLHGHSRPAIPSRNSGNVLHHSSTSSSIAGRHISDQSISQESNSTILLDRLSATEYTTEYSDASNRDQSWLSYSGSSNLSSSKACGAKAPKPAPLPYPKRQLLTPRSNPIRSSSHSDLSSQSFSTKEVSATLPRNWSPVLKPSNPAVPRVPRSERNPAIGLSEYQIVGPRAWKGDKYEEDKQSVIHFWTKWNRTRNPANKQQGLNLYENRSPSDSRINLPIQRNIFDVSSSPEYHSTGSSYITNATNPSRHSDPVLGTHHVKSPPQQARLSPSKLNFSRLNSHQNSKESTKGIPWLKTRMRKASVEEVNVWNRTVKDKIPMISARDSAASSKGSVVSDHMGEPQLQIPSSQMMIENRWV